MTADRHAKGSPVPDSSNLTPAQQRAAQLRVEAQRRERGRRIIAIVVGIVIVGGIIAAIALMAVERKGSKPPTFPAPADAKAAVAAAGLPMLGEKRTDYHIHSYLELSLNGRSVTVPTDIGIAKDVGLSPLHTHSSDGVIHVEAAEELKPNLGQFFKQWQVPLSATCVADRCADDKHELRAYVDGKPFAGDPTTIGLEAHRDITIAYVEKGKDFKPKRFDWASKPEL